MVDCKIFKNIKEKCGDEAANLLTCKNACITACETIHQDLEIDALIQMTASMPTDNYCEFAAKRA
jgi:aspartate carbamoyltransferase regulatory subunit